MSPTDSKTWRSTAFTYEGQTYGLPYAVENIALFRNTDLVPEAPATFEEMMQIAADFKAEHADDPTYLGLALQVAPEGDTYHYHPFLTAFGGYIFGQNEDGTFNPDDLGVDSEGGLAAATWLQEQAAAGLLSADVTYDVMTNSFGAGQAPFAVTGPWAITDQNNGFAMPAASRTRSARSRPERAVSRLRYSSASKGS